MGLTVSRKSVENPAIKRKNRQIGTLFVEKINFKDRSLLQWVI